MVYVNGDILTPVTDDRPTIVCHQVNCKGVMGSGLAKQVRAELPGVYEVYKEKCDAGFARLGQVQVCSAILTTGYLVANVFGQWGYGTEKRHTDYEALRNAFTYLAEAYSQYTIRIPYKMGCGLGGGDWEIVESIIKETLCDKGIEVEIWRCDSRSERKAD